MNIEEIKEIKEILDKLKDSNWYDELDLTGTRWIELTWKETHLLLDYITNLQERVEQLENENKILNNIIKELEKELREGSFDVYFCSTNTQKTFKSNEIIIKSLILDKLKELKDSD